MPLTIPELRTAASFLRQARVLVESVNDFFRSHDADSDATLCDISQRLNDQRSSIAVGVRHIIRTIEDRDQQPLVSPMALWDMIEEMAQAEASHV